MGRRSLTLMARPPRLELPGVPLHVIQRGNNRTNCFFGDIDRRFYLKCLADAAARRDCAIHAYVLMSNHVHLLVTPQAPGAVAAMLQDIGRKYVRVINSVQDRSGTLWEGRFKSCLVDSQAYLFTCHRYIELNHRASRLYGASAGDGRASRRISPALQRRAGCGHARAHPICRTDLQCAGPGTIPQRDVGACRPIGCAALARAAGQAAGGTARLPAGFRKIVLTL